jgi:DNA-binding MarR family transcriptional regulator
MRISCMAYFQNIYHSDLSHRARSVYMYLKDRADSEGRCWPGIRTIAAELGFSRSTVKRALDDLYGAGLLTREPRWRENGSLSSDLYRLV